jgi:hypothetical protein
VTILNTAAPLIKHLAATRPKAAALYERLPLIVIPADREFISREQQVLQAMPDLLAPPHRDFLMELAHGIQLPWEAAGKPCEKIPDRGRLWIRIRTVPSVRNDDATYMDRVHMKDIKDPSKWLLLEGWAEKSSFGGPPPSPDFSLLPLRKKDAVTFNNYWHIYTNRCTKPIFGIWCNINGCHTRRAAICALSELYQAAMCRLAVLSLAVLMERKTTQSTTRKK